MNIAPIGWKIVPIEPTERQLIGINRAFDFHPEETANTRFAYAKMIELAPEPYRPAIPYANMTYAELMVEAHYTDNALALAILASLEDALKAEYHRGTDHGYANCEEDNGL